MKKKQLLIGFCLILNLFLFVKEGSSQVVSNNLNYWTHCNILDSIDSRAVNIEISWGDFNRDKIADPLVYYEIKEGASINNVVLEKYYLETYLYSPEHKNYILKRKDQGTETIRTIEKWEIYDFNKDNKDEILVVKKDFTNKYNFYIMAERYNTIYDTFIKNKHQIIYDLIEVRDNQLYAINFITKLTSRNKPIIYY